jgi:hypothetical protein
MRLKCFVVNALIIVCVKANDFDCGARKLLSSATVILGIHRTQITELKSHFVYPKAPVPMYSTIIAMAILTGPIRHRESEDPSLVKHHCR